MGTRGRGLGLMSLRRNRVLPWIAAAVGIAIGLIGILIASQVGDAPSSAKRTPRIVDAKDIPRPDALTKEELNSTTKVLQADQISLQSGAWVQVADDKGRLEQQYHAARIDPEPDKWLRMEAPQAVMFPSGGRMVTMSADHGRMRVPKRALESGQLEGHVVIQVFKPVNGREIDLAKDQPAIIINAPEATFDSVLGEIRCDKSVKVVTEALRFEGEGLTMLLTEDGKGIERLTVERPLSAIEIERVASTQSSQPSAPAANNTAPPIVASANTPAIPAVVAVSTPSTKDANATGPTKSAAAKADAKAPAAPTTAKRFYKLILENDVRVLRTSSEGNTQINGDRLAIVFSMESDAVGQNMTRAFPAHIVQPSNVLLSSAMDWRVSPLLLAMAAHAAPSDHIQIQYRGRLVMTVVTDAADQLPNSDDVRLDIEGMPAKLYDEKSQARIDCGRMRYQTGIESVSLRGYGDKPFLLVSPRLDLEGQAFDLARKSGQGHLEGAGRMRIGSGDAAVSAMAAAPNLAQEAIQSGDAANAVVGPPDLGASARTVRIQWTKSVDLEFEPGENANKLYKADFYGDVNADAEEVRMVAQRLLVNCFKTGKGSAVERILADGGAMAMRQPEGSSLSAKTIDLTMEQTENGSSKAKRLLATGGVEAQDKGQRLWTDSLDCSFRPVMGKESATENMELSVVQSKGAVQALLAQDARLWAATMDADIPAKRVALRGPDLLLVRGNVVADLMNELTVDEDSGSAISPGVGRFRYWPKAIADSAPTPVARPVIPEKPQMEALWNDGLKYIKDKVGRATLDLRGKVRATADRTTRELDQFTANQAILTLGRDTNNLEIAGDAAKRSGLSSETSSLQEIHGVGDVRIESRAWGRDDRTDEPRLFRLMSSEVIHNVITGESNVPTAGTLLIFDRDDEGAKPAPPSLFDVRGSTRFRWDNSLVMNRDGETRYRITLEGGVELIHAGMRAQDTLTLTADQLENTVERLEAAPVKADATEATPVDFGAPVKLLRIRALGRVFVRTPDVDVECDAFDYDLRTKVATLTARPGRTISVMQKGKGSPIKAEAAVWDLDNGRVRVTNAAGSSFR
jgi:hypothetical protein